MLHHRPIRRGPRHRWALGLLGPVALVLAALAAPALAAPPANDSIASPTVIERVPARLVQSSSEATSSSADGECVFGASVWYRYRPTATRVARVVTVGSSYDTVLAVFSGPRSDRTLVRCDDDGVGVASAAQLRFVSGRTYWIAVSACCAPESTGGRTVLQLYLPRAAGVTLTLDSVRTGGVSGRLFVTGTLRCDTPSSTETTVFASQLVGDRVARGYGFVTLDLCNSRTRTWTAPVDSETGWAFQDGQVAVEAQAFSWDGFASATGEASGTLPVSTDPNARRIP